MKNNINDKIKNNVNDNISEDLNEELFVGEEDEEVVNCEGGPCNFIVKDK